MKEKQRQRDFLQNAAIAVLSVSAVLLFTQTQLYHLGVAAGRSYFYQMAGANVQTESGAAVHLTDLTAPVRVAVTGDYGRYGSVTLTTADNAFVPLGDLLQIALGSIQASAACEQAEFVNALNAASVYYDFLSPLPLSILSGMLGASPLENDTAVRYLVLSSREGEGVELYLWDGASNYLSCNTMLPKQDLEKTVNGYEQGNTVFAFEEAEYDGMVSWALLPEELPDLPLLAASMPALDTDRLLTVLGFNPRTGARYADSGAEVVVDGDRFLRIRQDGVILYQSGSLPMPAIQAAGDTLTLPEAVLGASSLLDELLSSSAGDASLYVQNIRQNKDSNQDSITVEFGYQVGGVPVRFSNGANAAEVTFSGTAVSTLSLRLRQYTVSASLSLLLPLRQALAIAAQERDAALSIGYMDNGEGTLGTVWLRD